MNTAPFESWDGAEAYYTWANSPTMLYLTCILTLAVVVWVIVQSIIHENKSFKRAEGE